MAEIEIPKPEISKPIISHSEGALDRSKNFKTTSIDKPKQPEHTGKTIKGKAKKRELTFYEKVKRSFVKEDMQNIGDYIVFDILIPGVKKAVFDVVVGSLSQALGVPIRGYDSVVKTSRGYSGNNGERVYRNYSTNRSSNTVTSYGQDRTRFNRFQVSDIVFEYKEDAMSLLEQMTDICDQYGWFSVFDFYDKAGIIEGNDHTNLQYGWHDVSGSTVSFNGSGYVINLPKARAR